MSEDDRSPFSSHITRRDYLATVGAVAIAAGSTALAGPSVPAAPGGLVRTQLKINGQHHDLQLDPRVTLLDLLRNHLQLTGTKKGCDHGQCGACTVLSNGRRINSCLSLAASQDGQEITTIEGLAHGNELHPLQAAFIEHDGLQCGYCTPGQICSGVALVSEARRGDASWVTADLAHSGPARLDDQEIRERMAGNICRCSAYPGILGAVKSYAESQVQSRTSGGGRS